MKKQKKAHAIDLTVLIHNIAVPVGIGIMLCLESCEGTAFVWGGLAALLLIVQWCFLHDWLLDVQATAHKEAAQERREARALAKRRRSAAEAERNMAGLISSFESAVGRQGKYSEAWLNPVGCMAIATSKETLNATVIACCKEKGYPYLSTYDGSIWFRVGSEWHTATAGDRGPDGVTVIELSKMPSFD